MARLAQGFGSGIESLHPSVLAHIRRPTWYDLRAVLDGPFKLLPICSFTDALDFFRCLLERLTDDGQVDGLDRVSDGKSNE